MTAQTFDWVFQAFLADPYRHYRQLRERDPVYYNEARGSFMLLRYADIVEVLRDDERFSAERVPQPPDVPRSMLSSDPPTHTRLRNLVNKAFTARTVRNLAPLIHEIVDELIASLSSERVAEVITQFAYPLAITVIAELLGVPAEDRDLFREASEKIALALGPIEDPAVAERALKARRRLVDYFNLLIPHRRAEPSSDLLTALLEAEEAGDVLSHGELLAMLLLLLVAGHETTVNLIGNGLLALLSHPDQLERLRLEEGIERQAIEELLRYDSPVQMTGRVAKEDLEIGSKLVRRGQHVTTVLASANRDPEVFADPDTLDLGRDPCPHLSFSAGIHYCLGAQLARLEGQIAISRFLRAFPDLCLATNDLRWRPAPILRGLEALPVELC